MLPNDDRFREDPAHDRVLELLPWYVNRTLPAGEREWVRTHLEGCASCREEAALLGAFAERLARAPVPPFSPEAAFARLRAGIAQRRPSLGERLRLVFGQRPALAPLAVALALLLAALPLGLRQWQAETGPGFHTLADPGSGERPAEGSIRVLFDESMGPDRIAALLKRMGGNPVGGPDRAGVYTVRLAGSTTVEEAVRRLRGEAGVLLAEPVPKP